MYKILLAVLIIVTVAGCSKDLPDVGGTSAQKMANEWWVTWKHGTTDLLGHPVKLSTYNTAANKDSIWVDDLEHGWQFKVKAKANYDSLTFSTTSSQNEY